MENWTIGVIISTLNSFTMAQHVPHKPTYTESYIHLLLEQDKRKDVSREVYLESVHLYDSVYLDSSNMPAKFVGLEMAFVVEYQTTVSSISKSAVDQTEHLGRDDYSNTAVFFRQENGIYKIMESSTLVGMGGGSSVKLVDEDGTEIVTEFFLPYSFQAIPGEYAFAGYSDDATLRSVKTWNYIKERIDSKDALWDVAEDSTKVETAPTGFQLPAMLEKTDVKTVYLTHVERLVRNADEAQSWYSGGNELFLRYETLTEFVGGSSMRNGGILHCMHERIAAEDGGSYDASVYEVLLETCIFYKQGKPDEHASLTGEWQSAGLSTDGDSILPKIENFYGNHRAEIAVVIEDIKAGLW